MFIPLSSLLVWRPLDLGLMTFSMHCISCMRGMGIISLGSLSLVSFQFHPITLAYVTSRVRRPPWGHDLTFVFDSSHVGNSRDWSEFISWSMMDRELRWWLTLGHTPLIGDGFSEATLSTLGHTSLIDDVFFRDDALHWGIVSSLLHLDYNGLAVVGWPYTGA